MNTSVSFPLAKLLKEKGFDEPCSHAYKEVESPVLYIHQDKKYNNSFKKEWQNTVRKNSQMDNAVINRYSAPTIAEVVIWLYEKYKIWINIYYNSKYKSWDYEYTNINWSQEEVDKKLEEDIHNLLDNIFNAKIKYNSPTEAYKAAIEYTLKNLI